MDLTYTPGERLFVHKTKNRIAYIREACRQRSVLDLGCYDETALIKQDSGHYLFNEISSVATKHLGVDLSDLIPDEGLVVNGTSRIIRGDIYELDQLPIDPLQIDIIIAGELIEHLPDTLAFFRKIKTMFPGKRLICTTPNTTALYNVGFAFIKRESAHRDHLQVYSYKTLNTLCRHAQFPAWEIIPYHVRFTEMILRSGGIKRTVINAAENIVNSLERLFPLTAGGYIIDIRL